MNKYIKVIKELEDNGVEIRVCSAGSETYVIEELYIDEDKLKALLELIKS